MVDHGCVLGEERAFTIESTGRATRVKPFKQENPSARLQGKTAGSPALTNRQLATKHVVLRSPCELSARRTRNQSRNESRNPKQGLKEV